LAKTAIKLDLLDAHAFRIKIIQEKFEAEKASNLIISISYI